MEIAGGNGGEPAKEDALARLMAIAGKIHSHHHHDKRWSPSVIINHHPLSSVIIRYHQSSSVITCYHPIIIRWWHLITIASIASIGTKLILIICTKLKAKLFGTNWKLVGTNWEIFGKILNIDVKEVLEWLHSVLYWCTMDVWNVGPSPFCFDLWNTVVNQPQEGKFQARTGMLEPIFYRAWTGHRSDVILTLMTSWLLRVPPQKS